MATLLGKYYRKFDDSDDDFSIQDAFCRAREYLPDGNYVFTESAFLCSADEVVFNGGGIDGCCVEGSCAKVHTYRVPCWSELYIFKGCSEQYYYVTTRRLNPESGSEEYVEFVFRREMHPGQLNRKAIVKFVE